MRRLMRDRKNGVVAGVAAGIARYVDVDPVIIRIGFIILALFKGLGFVAYAACWVLMPDDGTAPARNEAQSGAEVVDDDVPPARGSGPTEGRWIAGIALIVIGALLLIDRLPWFHWPYWVHFGTLWPLILVFIGIGLILRARRTPSANGGAS